MKALPRVILQVRGRAVTRGGMANFKVVPMVPASWHSGHYRIPLGVVTDFHPIGYDKVMAPLMMSHNVKTLSC